MGRVVLPRGYRRSVSRSLKTDVTTHRPGSASWWFRSTDGRLTLWQPPNPALCVWLATLVLGMLDLSDTHTTAVDGVRHGALVVWALDEVVRGSSPFRRLLGTAVLGWQLVSLVVG